MAVLMAHPPRELILKWWLRSGQRGYPTVIGRDEIWYLLRNSEGYQPVFYTAMCMASAP